MIPHKNMATAVPRLVVRDAAGHEREVEITQTPFTLGRQGDNDLVLLDNRISRQHARIVHDGQGYYVLEDLSSRHGTYVNGERIERCVLKDGDQLSLGVSDAYHLTFVSEEATLARLLERIGTVPESSAPRLQQINFLLQLAQMLHRAAALEDILIAVVDSALQLSGADRGILFLMDESDRLSLRLMRQRPGARGGAQATGYSEEIIQRVLETRREEMALENLAGGPMARETVLISGRQRAILAIPLQKLPVAEAGGETMRQIAPKLLGVLYLESSSQPAAITSLDRQALGALAYESAMIIENARLLRAAREQERSRHEMALARSIQQGLLPRSLPCAGHFQLHAVTRPCHAVGGDYYDVIPLPGDRVGLTVADVSGKGLPAAMMSMTLQGAFSALAAADLSLEELFTRINAFLCERTPPEMYATLLYGVLDPSGRFRFVNAGHAPPLYIRANGLVETLDSPNFPLGLFDHAHYEAINLALSPGEQVVIFSDGLTEAQNEALELFGEARLIEIARNSAANGLQPEEFCSKLIHEVNQFAGGAPPADDLTVAILRYSPAAGC